MRLKKKKLNHFTSKNLNFAYPYLEGNVNGHQWQQGDKIKEKCCLLTKMLLVNRHFPIPSLKYADMCRHKFQYI